MKFALTLAVLAGTLLPNAALARGCDGQEGIDDTAASCLPGFVWDEISATCVDKPTS